MGLAPPLNARHVLGITEVVAVGGFAQPSPLAGRLAGLVTIGFLAVLLPVAIAVIRQEKGVATAALTLLWLLTHRGVQTREKKLGIKPKAAKGRRTKVKKEEELSGEEPEENPREEKNNFKPAALMHFHFAADTSGF
jgi:hypothetical protein